MEARTVRVVERGPTLTALARALEDAVTGTGSLTFVAGEAGVGKTTLVRTFVERHPEVTSLHGACDNLSTPPPLGPLHDMATQHREVAALLQRPNRHELFAGLLEHLATPGRPVVVVLEDVHWADAATLDLLRYLGRRIERSHAAVLATYRSGEVGSSHPLRAVLGDLATAPGVARRTLAPLTVDGVAELAEGTGVDPVELHRRTDGNPFFVTEVLAHPDADLPTSLRDAVLARAGRLPSGARDVLDVASLVPSAVERELLDAVLSPDPRDVDACIASGMLRAEEGGVLLFRHELARLAIASAVLPARRTALHGRFVEALLSWQDPPSSRVAHHADAAGDGDTVLAHAVAAADAARARGAHQQATAQLTRALRYADRLPPAEQADLLERQAEWSGWTTDVGGSEIDRAVALRRELGDPHRLGNALQIQAIVRYRHGRSQEAYATSAEALRILEPLGESPELCDALTEAVTLAMLARRYEEARTLGTRAIEIAERLDRPRALAGALNSLGAVELLTDDFDAGVEHVLRSADLAREAGLDAEAARAIGNLGSGAGEVRRYEVAEPYLLESIEYAAERDLDDYARYSVAWLARVRFETGRWTEAEQTLAPLPLDDPGLSPITRITALAVRGRLRSRRGDPGVADALDPAWELAAATDDLQRTWPVAAARAEAALLDDRPEDVPDLVQRPFELARQLDHPWALGELGLQLWRAEALDHDGCVAVVDGGAEPYRLHVAGDVTAAAAAWERIGCPYERADALADGEEEQQLAALTVFDGLGAAPAAARLRRRLRAAGVRSVPRGPRPATADHPAGLTPRETEVLELVAEGLTNAQIGAALFISEKTAGNHVSSILAKLGASNRHEAARIAAQG